MIVENLAIDAIKPNSWNPNEMEDSIFRSLVSSIKKHGVLQPILVRNDRTIIKGEKRWRAAKEAGLEEVLCVVVETSEEEAKLLTIGLSHIRGTTNEELLSALLDELTAHFSLEEISVETGYQKDELTELLEGLPTDTDIDAPVEDDGFDVESALEDITEPETKYGDVWRLGRHILVCGDATKEEDVQKLMDGRKANLIVTDPPYNVAIKSKSAKLNESGQEKILNDDMKDEAFVPFLNDVFQQYASIMDDKAGIYVFHPSSYQREFENAMNAAGILVRTQCIWVKNSPTFGWAQYRFQHEPVFYAHLKGKAPNWYGDRKQTTVWRAGLEMEVPEPNTVWEVSRGDVSKYVHPTQKPLELIAIPIKNSSVKGDVIVDFFGGSGSTLMTCEQTDRVCHTLELDPKFCDVIKKRFCEATGIEPVLLNKTKEDIA